MGKDKATRLWSGALFTSPFLAESPLPTREAAASIRGTESGGSRTTALYRISVPPLHLILNISTDCSVPFLRPFSGPVLWCFQYQASFWPTPPFPA